MHQHSSDEKTQSLHPLKLSTNDIPAWNRREWLREVIGREYANVDITAPSNHALFNEMMIYPWQNLRLSVIQSNAINITRLPSEPHSISQDAYFAVVLLSGSYMLEQNNREVILKPGDMTIYDATRPHHIHCPNSFSKLIISIPRKLMRERIAGVEHCTALKMDGNLGISAVASHFIQSVARELSHINHQAFSATAENALDLFTLSLNSVKPQNINLYRSRSLSLYRVKAFVEHHLTNPSLDTAMIVAGTKLSARYINSLFDDENSSLMRHVWGRRLARCHQEFMNPNFASKRISETALAWGFNDLAHFSRAFKKKYGCSPRDFKTS